MKILLRTAAVASLAFAGTAYVAWQSVGPCGDAGARMLSVEQQANVYTYNRQEQASLDLDADGNALVAWGSRRQEAGTFGVFGRLFDGSGNPVGRELHINQHMSNNQESPAVSFHGTDAWVAWRSFAQDGNAGTVVARRFGRTADTFGALGDEVIVNETVVGDQVDAAVAAADGHAMIVWSSTVGDVQQTMGRIVNDDGTPRSGEFRLGNGPDTINETLPAVAAQPDGFVATWALRDAETGVPAGILARRFADDGTPRGDAFEVAAGTDRQDVEPSIDADTSGRFVVAWMGTNDTRGYDVLARRYTSDGTAIGGELTVAALDPNGDIDWYSGAAVAMAADGRFVVSYTTDVPDGDRMLGDIVAHRFAADGTPGEVFRVNDTTDGPQALTVSGARRVAWGADDRLAFAWNGNTGADGRGIGVTMLVPSDTVASAITVDERIVSAATAADAQLGEQVPPTFDPHWIPEKPEQITLAPGQDFGFIGFTSTGWNPPDPDIAAGPNGILVAVNGGVRYYDKEGNLQWSRSLTGGGGFWGAQGGGGFVFDPVELFDPHSNRFIIVCTEHSGSTDYLTVAISNDDDPSGSTGHADWQKYRFNVNNICGFIDFPNLGVGPDAVFVTTDCFDSPGGNKAWIMDKSELIAGTAGTPEWEQMSGGFFSLGAMKQYDDNSTQYFCTAEHGSSNSVQLKAITNPLTNPQVSTVNVSVPTYSSPPGAQQLGSSSRLATVGKRIKNGVLRNDHLWITHTIGQNNTARMRWYDIDLQGWPTSGSNPDLVNGGTQNLGDNVHNWFGDVDVDAQGNAAFAFNRSSPDEYVGVWRTFRLASDGSGLRDPVLMQGSTAPDTSGRWGDYGGIHQDPAQPNAFWNLHEYRTSSWRTWVGKFEIPVSDCPEDLDGDTVVGFGDILQILAVWGQAGGAEDLDGSGFVDFGDLLVIFAAWGPCP